MTVELTPTALCTAAIEVRGLGKELPGFALKDIDLTLPQGAIMGLIGENGAGKTVLIKTMLDLLKKDAGQVAFFGEEMHRESIALKADIGVIFDSVTFPMILTAQDLHDIYSRIYPIWDSEMYFSYLAQENIDLHKKIADYSKGMQMKLQIIAQLAHKPKLLIMDEPTSGLDPVARAEVLAFFQDFVMAEDHAILLSSHITSDLDKIADYIAYIDDGRLLFCEEKDTLTDVWGILKCPVEMRSLVPAAEILFIEEQGMGLEILIKNRSRLKDLHPDWIIERANVEQVMLFFVHHQRCLSQGK